MLTATSETRFGESRILSALLLERRFRAFLIWRHRLLFDSRFTIPAPGKVNTSTLYFALEGDLLIDGQPVTPPCAYVIATEEFEVARPGRSTFRSWGDPSVSLEIQVATADVVAPVGLAHGPVPISPATWSAIHALVEAVAVGAPIDPLMAEVLAGLVHDRIVVEAMASSVTPEPESSLRVWRAMSSLYNSYNTSISLFGLARDAGVSLRQLRRDIKLMAKTYALYGAGFRETVQMLRLRFAVLLLSAPEVTIKEIAERVGYGGLDALGRAFRDHDMPAPNVVRDAVLYPT